MNFTVLFATLLAALLAACSATTDAPSSAARSAASPTVATVSASSGPTTHPSATPSDSVAEPPTITWSEVAFEGSITAVTSDGDRFVAVGVGSDGSAAWTSNDGVTWEEHAVPDKAVAEPNPGITVDAVMRHLVRLDDTLYSFGGQVFIDLPYLVAWRWTDGEAWQIVESQNEFFAAGGSVQAVAASDEALLVAKSYPYSFGTITWRWTAETSWKQTAREPAGRDRMAVVDFAWADGIHVAVGQAAEPQDGVDPSEWATHPAILTSSDGASWSPVAAPAEATGLCDVSPVHAGGFIALGWAGDRAAAWTSPDGVDWMESAIEAADRIETPTGGCQVVSVNGGLLAVIGTADGSMLTWTSTDGRALVAGEALPASGQLANIGDRVVFVSAFDFDSAASQLVLHGRVEP